MLRDFAVALSLANLCFLQAWRAVLDPASVFYYYHWKSFPGWAALAAITLNVLALATIFFAGATLARRPGKPFLIKLARASFILAFLFALNSVRLQFDSLLAPNLFKSPWRAAVLATAFFLVGLFLFKRFTFRQIFRAAVTLVLILAPLVPLTFAQGLWLTAKYARALEDQPGAKPLPVQASAPRTRVLWLVFDELDQRVAFAERPAGLLLPELDRLRGESLVATEAYPPARDTLLSLPALVTGELISAAKQTRTNDLRVTLRSNDETTSWASRPNVFTRAREAGHNTALVGWYHPYCRLLGGSLTSCFWEAGSAVTAPEKLTVRQNALEQIRAVLMSLPAWQRSGLGPRLDARVFKKTDAAALKRGRTFVYQSLREEALKVATRRDIGLAFVHLSVPHPPGIYDRASQQFSLGEESSYLDNLALTDRTLGELRAAMEAAGLWDETAVLVTSDHWLRVGQRKMNAANLLSKEDVAVLSGREDFRVPFILKLPRQKEGSVYESRFNTVVSQDLLLAVLRGELTDARGVAVWLDARRDVGANLPYDTAPGAR